MTLTAVKSMDIVNKSLTAMMLTQLEKFRQALYDCLPRILNHPLFEQFYAYALVCVALILFHNGHIR